MLLTRALYRKGQDVCLVQPVDVSANMFSKKNVERHFHVRVSKVTHTKTGQIYFVARTFGDDFDKRLTFCVLDRYEPGWYPIDFFKRHILPMEEAPLLAENELTLRWYDAAWGKLNFRDGHSESFCPSGWRTCSLSKAVRKRGNQNGVFNHFTFVGAGDEGDCPYCRHVEKYGQIAFFAGLNCSDD